MYDDEKEAAETMNVAPGWAKAGVETDGTDTLDESADAHSGGKSQLINVANSDEGIVSDGNCFTANKWHLITMWIKATAGNVRINNNNSTIDFTITSPGAAWTRYSFVGFSTAANIVFIRSVGGGANFLVDDVSVCQLNDVSITCVPASLANSQE